MCNSNNLPSHLKTCILMTLCLNDGEFIITFMPLKKKNLKNSYETNWKDKFKTLRTQMSKCPTTAYTDRMHKPV